MQDIYIKADFDSEITNEQLKTLLEHSIGCVVLGRSVVLYARYYRYFGCIHFVFRVEMGNEVAKKIKNIKIKHFLDLPKITKASIMNIKEVKPNPKIKFIVE